MLDAAQKAAWIAAFVFLAVFFVLMVVKASTSPEKQEQHHQQPNNSNRQPEPEVMSHPGNQNRYSWSQIKKSAKQYRDQFIKHVERREKAYVALSGIAVAAFTLALFFATWLLWSAGERHSERQLRAYLFVTSEQAPFLDEWPGKGVILKLENFGQTPAYDVSYWYGTDFKEIPLTAGLAGAPQPPVDRSRTILHPRQINELTVRTNRALSDDEKKLILGRTHGIYVYGEITYRDAFNSQRISKFRYIYESFSVGGGMFRGMRWASEGNEAD